MTRLPSYEGSGLKFLRGDERAGHVGLPSYEGSGLKSVIKRPVPDIGHRVSPRMRGVD